MIRIYDNVIMGNGAEVRRMLKKLNVSLLTSDERHLKNVGKFDIVGVFELEGQWVLCSVSMLMRYAAERPVVAFYAEHHDDPNCSLKKFYYFSEQGGFEKTLFYRMTAKVSYDKTAAWIRKKIYG